VVCGIVRPVHGDTGCRQQFGDARIQARGRSRRGDGPTSRWSVNRRLSLRWFDPCHDLALLRDQMGGVWEAATAVN